ncbi:MAG: aldo/keto reductase [Microbacteriaceae bacterium]|nr:aldo/keto reductase [Microbacteriaceae bacterium]
MEERTIGNVTASVVGLGCNQFGLPGGGDSTRVVHAALDAGVTFFDTADEYGYGVSETILGMALAGRRSAARIATKVGCVMPGVIGSGGASPEWIRQSINDSLRRLKTDYVDLYQVHYSDPATPIEATLETLADLVTEGKILEYGCCNFSVDQLASAEVSPGGHFSSTQVHLNLLRTRALDAEVAFADSHGIAVIPYWPLASGLLTGKYHRDGPLNADTRMSRYPEAAARMLTDRNFTKLEKLATVAHEADCTVIDLAIAWLLAQVPVATVIAGATSVAQVQANARAGARVGAIDLAVIEAATAAVGSVE